MGSAMLSWRTWVKKYLEDGEDALERITAILMPHTDRGRAAAPSGGKEGSRDCSAKKDTRWKD